MEFKIFYKYLVDKLFAAGNRINQIGQPYIFNTGVGYISDCNRPAKTVNYSLKIITFIETNIYHSLSTNRQGLAYSLLFVSIYKVCAFFI